MAADMIVDRIKVIDVDTHITEPPNVWTDRVSRKKWGDRIPHIRAHPETGNPVWFINEKPSMGVANTAMAGWKEWPPSAPPTLEEADPAAWDSTARIALMDDYGLHAQLIYPNVGGFGNGNFLKLEDPELMLECVRAYNDFLTDWCSVDPKRLIPICATPFWDVDATVAEIERCFKNGHKGVLFTGAPQNFGQEPIGHPQWEPVWHIAEDLGMPINFHIGSGGIDSLFAGSYPGAGIHANFAGGTVGIFLGNWKHIIDVIITGICHRHPNLNFVSVESGIGWLPFALEALEWQWYGTGVHEEHPEFDLGPTEYFKRQIHACFWFEEKSAFSAIDQLGPDNFLYETDFPHPTSMSPGPKSPAVKPKDWVERVFGKLPEETQRKVLHDNAARIYHLDD